MGIVGGNVSHVDSTSRPDPSLRAEVGWLARLSLNGVALLKYVSAPAMHGGVGSGGFYTTCIVFGATLGMRALKRSELQGCCCLSMVQMVLSSNIMYKVCTDIFYCSLPTSNSYMQYL